jgi:hypothetical protein
VSQEWYFSAGNERHGPVSAADLKKLADAGTLKAADLVWKDGMADWVPARSIKGLFPAGPPAPVAPKSGKQPAARPRPAAEEPDDRPSRRRRENDEDDNRPSHSRRRGADDEENDRPRTRRRDEEDDRPPIRKGRRDDDEDEEDDDRPRRKRRKRKAEPQLNAVGAFALGTGILALIVSLIPCLGMFGAIPAFIGLILAVLGLVVAKKSDGAQSPGLPVAGLSVSLVALLIAGGWFFWLRKVDKDLERDMAEDARQEAEWNAERAKEKAQAVKDVQAAGGGAGVVRVTAIELARAYDQDEDQADARFKDRVLEVTGTIRSVDLDDDGDAYVVLLRGIRDGPVDCGFAKDPAVRERLARLKPGDTVTIRGKCLGGGPTLEACVLVE